MDGGLYVAIFALGRAEHIEVGRLGRYDFPPGLSLYVGSAQRTRQAPLERHARPEKPLRWHADYLSTRAGMLGALLLPGGRKAECELAAELAGRYARHVPGFGASDCRCPGHLFHVGEWADL